MQPHTCQLSGLVLIPSPNYPTGPVSTIPASSWTDTVNSRLLYPILATQLFLPLLTMKHNSSTIVLLSPSIQSAVSAPFTSPEVTTTRALSGFASSLRQELYTLESTSSGSVEVIELKLGNLDFGRQFRNYRGQNKGTEVLTWQPQQRALYGSSYLSTAEHRVGWGTSSGEYHGTPARALHFAVFDALAPSPKTWTGRRKRKEHTVYVGRGAKTYAVVGSFLPGGVIGWMLGLRTGYGFSVTDASFENDANSSNSEGGWEKVAKSSP